MNFDGQIRISVPDEPSYEQQAEDEIAAIVENIQEYRNAAFNEVKIHIPNHEEINQYGLANRINKLIDVDFNNNSLIQKDIKLYDQLRVTLGKENERRQVPLAKENYLKYYGR